MFSFGWIWLSWQCCDRDQISRKCKNEQTRCGKWTLLRRSSILLPEWKVVWSDLKNETDLANLAVDCFINEEIGVGVGGWHKEQIQPFSQKICLNASATIKKLKDFDVTSKSLSCLSQRRGAPHSAVSSSSICCGNKAKYQKAVFLHSNSLWHSFFFLVKGDTAAQTPLNNKKSALWGQMPL